MGIHGCRATGELDDSWFGYPLPYIGLFSAAASAACLIAMGIDTFHGIRNRKFWFPCKLFSLNAFILILIAAATKLSVDLNTSMPRKQDQLVKLTSSSLACTVMANFLPSLGSMENKELLINMSALAIYVVTIQINVCIQLGTGVIYMFGREHVGVLFLMLVLFGILVSSALTIPATKSYFEQKYTRRYKKAMLACKFSNVTCNTQKIRDDLNRFWMMAHSSSPQFVVGRLATCTASGAVCLLNTVVLAEVVFRAFFIPGLFQFCQGESDYKWSSTLILVVQLLAIVIGSIAPAFRWFNAINIICPVTVASENWKVHLEVEDYWTRSLRLWKEHPFVLGIRGRLCRKIIHKMKNQLLQVCIGVQIMMVFFCKLIRLVSIYLAACPILMWRSCNDMLLIVCCKLSPNSVHGSELPPSNSTDVSRNVPYVYRPEPTLNNYVLHLEGEKNLNNAIMAKNFEATNEWMEMGMKMRPGHLEEYLRTSSTSEFDGVWRFDAPEIEPIHSPEPPNCWSLPVVTLCCIAVALSKNELRSKELLRRIKEGISLVRIVEESLDSPEGRLTSIRKAADMVWLGLDFSYKWLDFDLYKLHSRGRTQQGVLSELANKAERIVRGFLDNNQNKDLIESPSKWPSKILAANSMYRICKTLQLMNLDQLDGGDEATLSEIIADVMGACLTNLRRVISMECKKTAIEEREERVLNAIVLFGKTKELLKILDERVLPGCLVQDELGSIDGWRATRPRGTV